MVQFIPSIDSRDGVIERVQEDSILSPGMRKRKRSAGSAAYTFVGGIATNKITTFLVEAKAEVWKRKRQKWH